MQMPPEAGMARTAAQIVFFFCVAAVIGYFSHSPQYHYSEGDSAELKFVIRHSGRLAGECRALDVTEMKKLAKNMRVTEICPREKLPMSVSLELEGRKLYAGTIQPSGIRSDGVLSHYDRFTIPAGPLQVCLVVDVGDEHEVYERSMEAGPAEVLLLEYNDQGFSLSRATETGRREAG